MHINMVVYEDYARFAYKYGPNTFNITKMTYEHRSNDPCVDFSYDDLGRLTKADYHRDSQDEQFTLDDLGNRDEVNVRGGTDVNYVADANTNRYLTVGGNSLS